MTDNFGMLQIDRIDGRHSDPRARLHSLREKLSVRGDIVSEAGRRKTLEVFGEPLTPQQVVERICRGVAEQGLPAVLDYTHKLDAAELTDETIRVSPDELATAHAAADADLLATVRRIRDNVTEFAEAILHRDVSVTRPGGVILKQRYTPLRRVGVCVPGGAAAYPSTVLMSAVPALAAGVKEVAIIAPPTRFGANNQDVLATCREIGIEEVYRVGGAQGVAMLAHGVSGVAAVDKIVGPGNLFVALAKQTVFGTVDIDSIAGPSEVVVIADATSRGDFVAADLLAQAEHSPGSAVLVTWSQELLEAVHQELTSQLEQLSRNDLTRVALEEFGALILVNNPQEAAELTDWLAPEHLHIQCREEMQLAEQITAAGATFVGSHTPVALGDYAAGPSHVLPTGGTARWASGLSANSFLRSSSLIHYPAVALPQISADVKLLAEREELTAHKRSVTVREADGGEA